MPETTLEKPTQDPLDHARDLFLEGKSEKYVELELSGRVPDYKLRDTISMARAMANAAQAKESGEADEGPVMPPLSDAAKTMLWGMLWLAGGVILTVVSLANPDSNGTSRIFVPAIFYGAFKFGQGLWRFGGEQ